MVNKKGSWFSLGVDVVDSQERVIESEDTRMGQGTDNALEFLRGRPELMDALYDMIMDDAGIRVNIN